jgi:uncharacterized protein (DUF58 family)
VPALADALAGVEPSLIDTDWDAAFAEARRLVPRPALVVLLTAQDEAEAARGLLGSLPALARGGTHVLLASAVDPTLAEMTASRRDAAAVYRAASAERTLRDAERVAAAAGRAGTETIAASAAELPPRVADHYLRLKALGRL